MRRLLSGVGRFLRAEDGPTAVEYAVMIALISLMVVSSVRTLGCNANDAFENTADGLPE